MFILKFNFQKSNILFTSCWFSS